MNNADNKFKFYHIADIAKVLGITQRTATVYCEKAILKARKIGGKWTVSEKNLQAFIDAE